MALDCGLLTGDIGSCTDTTSKGFEQKAIIGNFSEIDTKTFDATDPLVTALTMESGKTAFTVTVKGLNPYEDFSVGSEARKTGNVFTNQIMIHAKGLTPANSKVVKLLSDGVFFMVLTQRGETGNSKYPIPGIQAGLKASAVEWSTEEGAFIVTLDEASCDYPLMFAWASTLGATDTMIEGLLT